MQVEMSGDTSSQAALDPQFVASVFVNQYYKILEKSPEILHKFYNDQSVIDRPEPDGEMISVTTMQAIDDKIMCSDYKGCLAEIINVDAQESLMEGVLVAVTGCLIGEAILRKKFFQTFFLAKQEKGFFVLNDILRFVDVHEALIFPSSNETEKNASIVPVTNNLETLDVPAQPKTINTSTCKEVTESVKMVSDAKEAAEVSKPSVSSIQNTSTLIHPASNVKQEVEKTSYASMVAKESKVTSPTHTLGYKIVRVAANADQQPTAAPSGDSVPTSNSVTKELNSSNGATENSSTHGDASTAKSVYIGNLPSNITKQGLLDAIKIFGRVKPGGIQLKTFEDGFCFGFAEFESASSAQNAVEVHNITIGVNEAYIMYKRSGTRSGNGTGSSGGLRSGNFKAQENGEIRGNGGYPDDNKLDSADQGWGFSGQSRETNQWKSQSRDGRARGREAYGSDERWSNGEAYRRNGQRDDRGRNGDAYHKNNQRRYERAPRQGG